MNKQSLTGCDHSEIHLSEEGNDVFTLNGQIKGKFVSKNIYTCIKNVRILKDHLLRAVLPKIDAEGR